MTKDELIAFEADIAAEFNAAKIRAPIHLDGGNEDKLIELFDGIDSSKDWIFCTWRSHYKALLHGIPPEKVKAAIMGGHSISLTFLEHRFYSSAIVGGNLPIALGVAWAIKRAGKSDEQWVWAFTGDMAAHGGMFHECRQYAQGFGLPITFVVEDNGLSVCTDTVKAWSAAPHERRPNSLRFQKHTVGYSYELPWPHSGAGRRVEF